MKKNAHSTKCQKAAAFVLRGGRAPRRAAHNVRTQNRAHHLPVIVWQNGQVVEQPAWTRGRDLRYELITDWSKADGSFVVEVPELRGCMADGASDEAAVANAQAVIQERIDTARSVGRPIPEPRGKLAYSWPAGRNSCHEQ